MITCDPEGGGEQAMGVPEGEAAGEEKALESEGGGAHLVGLGGPL